MKATAMCKANCAQYVKRMLSCYGWMAVHKLASYRGNRIAFTMLVLQRNGHKKDLTGGDAMT